MTTMKRKMSFSLHAAIDSFLVVVAIAEPAEPTPIHTAATPIFIDGVLDEPVWQQVNHDAASVSLRLMRELEYGKACRGPPRPVPSEFAWGTDPIASSNNPITCKP